MKRLIAITLVSLFSLLSVTVPVSAQQRFVKVEIFKPAATSNRTLNVEYKVLSTLESDNSFGVQLYENNIVRGAQEINHPYGDSGVFNISLPATGTYSYFVRTFNHNNGDSVKDSSIVTVQITNAPQPTITTVYTNSGANTTANTAAATGGQGGAQTNATDAGGVNATDDQAVAGTTTPSGGTGQVDPGAATTEKDKKDVLGAETKTASTANNKSKVNNWWYVGGGLALLAAGAAYYFLNMRRANNE